MNERFDEALEKLNEREVLVLKMRYGLIDDQGALQAEVLREPQLRSKRLGRLLNPVHSEPSYREPFGTQTAAALGTLSSAASCAPGRAEGRSRSSAPWR